MKLSLWILTLFFLTLGQSWGQEISNDNLELDHIFIWTSEPSQIQSLLKANGFNVYIGAEHSGQGTIGFYLFFHNTYLEFLSLSNESDFISNARKSNLSGMMLKEKWETNKVSPFGIGLHLKDTSVSKINFDTFHYTQAWMKQGTSLKVANSLNLYQQEPMIFIVPDYLKMNKITSSNEANAHQLHSNNLRTLTSAVIICNHCQSFSDTADELNTMKNFNVKIGEEDLLELVFDSNQQNKEIDLRPQLPVILKY